MPEQRTATDRQQHLYLLFDDWDSGFSIRKVSLSRRSGKQPLSSGSDKEGVEPVPEVFMHMQATRGYPDLFTSAFGTKIMVMDTDMDDGIPMIDVQEQALVYGPDPCNYYVFPIYFPVGDNKLFVLDVRTFDCYLRMPEDSEEPWGSYNLACPPFDRTDVSSYGVLPDGCILVSTTKSTFIFDTTKEEHLWKPYGNWVLPFTVRGHYDTSLGGFVGLSEDRYLYCSTMAASTGTGLDTGKTLHPSPDVKRTKNKLYTEGQHVSATLVHMRQGRFCLVECVSADNARTGQELKSWFDEFRVPPGATAWDVVGGGPQGGRCMYRLKTFSLIYDTKGFFLKLTACKVRRYSLPHEARIGSVCMDPVAFWL